MAIVFHDGFEMGGFGEWPSVTGSPTLVTTGEVDGDDPNTGSYCMRCNTSSGTAYVGWGFSGSLCVQFTAYIYIADAPDSDTQIFGSSSRTFLKLTTTREIDLYGEVSGKLADGSTQLDTNTWYRISGTADNSEDKAYVWIDGNIEHNGITVDSAAWSASLDFGVGIIDSCTADLYFDDVILSDTTKQTTDIGDIRTLVSLPAGAGNYSTFTTAVPDVTHYLNYDDAPGSISDADYVRETEKTGSMRDTATIQSCATAGIGASDTINAVTVWARMSGDNVDATAGITIRDNGTDYDYEEVLDDNSAYLWYDRLMVVMPNGSGAWTHERFDVLEAGMIHGGDSDDSTLTALMVMIAYTPVGDTSQTVYPTAIASTASFGTATIIPDQSVSPTAIESTASFGTLNIIQEQFAYPDAIESGVSFGTLIRTSPYTAYPDAIESTASFGTAKLNLKVYPTAISSTASFGTPVVIIDQEVSPNAIASTASLGEPVLTTTITVYPDVFEPTLSFGTTQANLKVYPTAIESTASFGEPQLDLAIYPDALTSSASLGTLTIVQEQFITPTALESTVSFGTAKLNLTIYPDVFEPTLWIPEPQVNLKIYPTAIESTASLGEVVIETAGAQDVYPDAIESTASFGTAKLNLTTYPEGVYCDTLFGEPQLNLTIYPTGIKLNLYEHYNTGDNLYSMAYGALWFGQSFTPTTTHQITSVKLKLWKDGSPGTVTVSIRATEGGVPIGEDLCSGTTDGDTLPDNPDTEWREITLGNGCTLNASTMYAIVFRALDGDSDNTADWRGDTTSPTYTGGAYLDSDDSGSSWGSFDSADFMFEEWGSAIGIPTITVGQSILPEAIESTATFGTLNIEQDQTVTPDAIESTASFGTLIAVQGQFIAPTAIGSTVSFGTSQLNLKIYPDALSSTATIGTVKLNRIVYPDAIVSTASFGTCKLNLTIYPNAIVSTASLGDPIIILQGAPQIVSPSGIVSTVSFGTCQLNLAIYPTALASSASVSNVTITTTATVIPDAIVSTASFGTARVSFALIVQPVGIVSTVSFGTLQVNLTIYPGALTSGVTFGTLSVWHERILYIAKSFIRFAHSIESEIKSAHSIRSKIESSHNIDSEIKSSHNIRSRVKSIHSIE